MKASFNNPVLLVANLKAALRAAMTDETRPHLNAIRVEVDPATRRARFVATNGSWLWINEMDRIEPAAEHVTIHVRVADAKRIMKIVNVKSPFPVDLTIADDGKAYTFEHCGSRISAPIDANIAFPPYVQVIPASFEMTASDKRIPYSIGAELLTGVSDAFVDIIGAEDRRKNCGLTFAATGADPESLAPIVLTSASDYAPYALAVLMPRRDFDHARGEKPLTRAISLSDHYKRERPAPTVAAAAE